MHGCRGLAPHYNVDMPWVQPAMGVCLLQPLLRATLCMLSRWCLLLFGVFHQQFLGIMIKPPKVYTACCFELCKHTPSLVYNSGQGAGTIHQGCQCHSSNSVHVYTAAALILLQSSERPGFAASTATCCFVPTGARQGLWGAGATPYPTLLRHEQGPTT